MSCCKKGYGKKTSALDAAARALNRPRRLRDTGYLRVYFCDKCGLWHLTKKKFGQY